MSGAETTDYLGLLSICWRAAFHDGENWQERREELAELVRETTK